MKVYGFMAGALRWTSAASNTGRACAKSAISAPDIMAAKPILVSVRIRTKNSEDAIRFRRMQSNRAVLIDICPLIEV